MQTTPTLPKRQLRNMSLGEIKVSAEKMVNNKFLVNNESDEDILQKTKGKKQRIHSQKIIGVLSPYKRKNNVPKNTSNNSDKAFFILLEQISDLLKIGSGTPQEDIEQALKSQTMSDVALLIGDKIQIFKLEYVKQEFINIQLKEQLEAIKQSSIMIVDPDTSFKQYAKVHEANQRWKSLFFAEARTVVDLCKNLCEATAQLEQHRQYIEKLEDKILLQEDKYLDLFEQYHSIDSENRSDNLPSVNKRSTSSRKRENKNQKMDPEKQVVQIKDLTNQNQKMLQQLQEELKRHHAIQDLRIGDLQYIMSLENKIEEMTIN